MPLTQDDKKEVTELITSIVKEEIGQLFATDRYTFQKNLQVFDGRNVQVGRTTGTKIGTNTVEKLGFYGVAPVVQQGGPSKPTGGSDTDGALRTQFGNLVDTLVLIGIIK